jgi:hypothetical protein
MEMQANRPAYVDIARGYVFNYILDQVEPSNAEPISTKDVFVVWFTKTLKNWKAMVSTTLSDGIYYEVTYNGEKQETYIDVYKKTNNVCIKD